MLSTRYSHIYIYNRGKISTGSVLEVITFCGNNLGCIKSYCYFDAFVGYFVTILQNAQSIYQDNSVKMC
jgi:hypothetical protein